MLAILLMNVFILITMSLSTKEDLMLSERPFICCWFMFNLYFIAPRR